MVYLINSLVEKVLHEQGLTVRGGVLKFEALKLAF